MEHQIIGRFSLNINLVYLISDIFGFFVHFAFRKIKFLQQEKTQLL